MAGEDVEVRARDHRIQVRVAGVLAGLPFLGYAAGDDTAPDRVPAVRFLVKENPEFLHAVEKVDSRKVSKSVILQN